MIDKNSLFDDIDTAYKKGYECYHANGYYSDNPYSAMLSPVACDAWNNGFAEALAESLNHTHNEKPNIIGFTLAMISITIVFTMIVVYLTVEYF